MANPQLFTVSFGGDTFTIVQDNIKHYIHLQPLIERIGLSWKRQQKKLRDYGNRFDWRDYACDGQVYLCLALNDLAAFLATVNPASVAPQVRSRLAYYRDKCPGRIRQCLEHGPVGDNLLVDILRDIGFDRTTLKCMGLVTA